MSRRTILARLLLALCLAVPAALARAPAARAETITVTHWGGQFYGAPYAVAMDKGFFRKRGVDINGILTAPGGGTAVRNVLAGGIPFGEVSLAAAVQAINAGEKLVIVAGGTQSVADQLWMVKKDSALHGIKDLAGKRIGYTAPGSVSNMVILMALRDNGMTSKDVKLVPAGDLGANLSAVISGAIDAGFADQFLLSQNTSLVQPVFLVKDVMSPKMMQTVCITTVAFATAHPDVVKAIIAGRRDGLDFIRQHPDEAGDITARAYNNPKQDLFRNEIRTLIGLDYWSDGRLDYDGMNRMVDGLRITGQLKGAVDWAKMVDTAYLPPDLRAAK